jgi:hypothetical protein
MREGGETMQPKKIAAAKRMTMNSLRKFRLPL